MPNRILIEDVSIYSDLPNEYRDVVELWLLRLLLRLGLHTHFNSEQRFIDDSIRACLQLANAPETKHDPDRFYRAMVARLEELEKCPPSLPGNTTIAHQLRWFASTVGIEGAALDILHFTLMSKRIDPLEKALDALGLMQEKDIVRICAVTLGHSLSDVNDAFIEDGAMTKSGILWMNPDGACLFSHKVHMPDEIGARLGTEYDDPMHLFRGIVAPGKPASLTLADYPHLQDEVNTLCAYLAHAIETHLPGVNILLYGPPGTGKTELARAVVQEIGAELHEVPTVRSSGAASSGGERMRFCRLAQSLLGQRKNGVLMFDEAEDAFNPEPSEQRRTRSYTKAWFTRFLETTNMPVIWIANALWVSDMGLPRPLDPAYLRRFDIVIKVDVPPRSVRSRILERKLDGFGANPAWVQRMAEHDRLAPAVVERAAKVVASIKDKIPGGKLETTLETLMGTTLEAMGIQRMPRTWMAPNTRYRLDCLNVDADLSGLCDTLSQVRAARMCLYGPPGTGKTAFGHHVAERLDQAILVKRASDILSPFVGETEQNMARIFDEARKENAVLLIDEVDSFLRDRQGANRSWEVTEVNEMLTQIENFEGILIASTNLMVSLDPAAMRRFDIKLRFDYLRTEQAAALLIDGLQQLGIETRLDEETMSQFSQLNVLTPGDFSAALRRARLSRFSTPGDLVIALRQECELKQNEIRRPVGFLS